MNDSSFSLVSPRLITHSVDMKTEQSNRVLCRIYGDYLWLPLVSETATHSKVSLAGFPGADEAVRELKHCRKVNGFLALDTCRVMD